MIKKALPTTSGFTQAGVYARRQFCGDLEVYRPPKPLCNPRLREAATTLAAILRTAQRILQAKKDRAFWTFYLIFDYLCVCKK